MFFRALRVISAFSAFYHLHPSVGIFAHSPNLPLSSSPGSGSTYLYTLYTFCFRGRARSYLRMIAVAAGGDWK